MKNKKPARIIMDEEDVIKELEAEVKELRKKIDGLERQCHVCSACGNVDRPSHYADGC